MLLLLRLCTAQADKHLYLEILRIDNFYVEDAGFFYLKVIPYYLSSRIQQKV